MKVLHLPIILVNQPSEIVWALNKKGIKADYAVLDTQGMEWLINHSNITYDLQAGQLAKKDPSTLLLRKKFFQFLTTVIPKYDIFHFHSNISIFSQWFNNFDDLKILKQAGKKIVVSYWGCDIRLKQINLKYKYNTCFNCKIDCDDNKKIFQSKSFTKFADLKIAHGYELLPYAPPGAIMVPACIDTNFWKNQHNRPNFNQGFKVLHPFGNSKFRGDVKGTNEIIHAVKVLNKKGYKINFSNQDRISNKKLKKYYLDTDIVVEQLKYGTYGITALEAMSLGIPVIGYVRKNIRDQFDKALPIIDATPENIEEVLEWAINNPQELGKISQKARKFVENFHDSAKVADLLIEKYHQISRKSFSSVPKKETLKQLIKTIKFRTLILSSNYLKYQKELQKKSQIIVNAGFETIVAGWIEFSDHQNQTQSRNGYEIHRLYSFNRVNNYRLVIQMERLINFLFQIFKHFTHKRFPDLLSQQGIKNKCNAIKLARANQEERIIHPLDKLWIPWFRLIFLLHNLKNTFLIFFQLIDECRATFPDILYPTDKISYWSAWYFYKTKIINENLKKSGLIKTFLTPHFYYEFFQTKQIIVPKENLTDSCLQFLKK